MSGPGAGAPARAVAARVVSAVIDDGRSLKQELARYLPTLRDPRDRALVEAICFEALRWRRRYEHALGMWMSRPLPSRSRRVHALLLSGLAQLDAMRLPPHAALAATAEAARLLDAAPLVGLVNAVLRRATREPLPVPDAPGVLHSHPDWLLSRLRQDWPGDVEALLAANNTAAPMWLRVNAARTSRDGYAARLAAAGIEVAEPPQHPGAALGLVVPQAATALPGWETGDVSVQDLSAQLAVHALDPKAGERVLDACAAPGGKSAHLREYAGALDLCAIDRDPARLARVGETLARLGLASGVACVAADAADTASWWDGRPFDAVLLDAPCSATGIIRRQPDIKWHRRSADVDALVQEQARLLDALWPLLRPGGRLLYATCSVLRAENALQVEAFLARTADARALPLDARYGRADGAGWQRLPGEDGGDGFFYALLQRAG